MEGVNEPNIAPLPDHVVLGAMRASATAFMVFGFPVDGPARVLQGIVRMGFAAGLVSAVPVPVIIAVNGRRYADADPPASPD
jgi:hypothetical protein